MRQTKKVGPVANVRVRAPGSSAAWRLALPASAMAAGLVVAWNVALVLISRTIDLPSGGIGEFGLIAAALLGSDVLVLAVLRLFVMPRNGASKGTLGLSWPRRFGAACALAIVAFVAIGQSARLWTALTNPVPKQPTELALEDPESPPTVDRPRIEPGPAPAPPKPAVRERDERHSLIKVLSSGIPAPRLVVLIVLSACLLAPIVEELFFRGFLLRSFSERFGPSVAVLASSVLFAGAHFTVVPLENLVPLTAMGIVLALLTRATRSIVPAIAVHGLINAQSAGFAARFGTMTWALMIATVIALVVVLAPHVGPQDELATSERTTSATA